MFYDWYLSIKFNREKKRTIKEIELEDFVRNRYLEQKRRTCEHSYKLVGTVKHSEYISPYSFETRDWVDYHLYCPKCDKERVVHEKEEVEIILKKQNTRDKYARVNVDDFF